MPETITPELRDAIRAAFAEHGSVSKVARECGVNWHTANRYAATPAPAPATPAITPELLAAALQRLGVGVPSDGLEKARGGPVVPSPADPHRNGLVFAEKLYGRVLWLSDLHVPYHDARAIDATLDYARDWRPDLIVIGGDFFDMYGISRWEKDPSRLADSVQREFDAGRPIVAAIDSIGSDVVYILGNHEARLAALVAAHPALDGLRALGWQRLAELPGRWTILPDQSRYRLGSLDFLHGNLRGRGGGAKHIGAWMYAKLKRTCLFGHFHKAQTYIDPDGDGTPRGGFATGHLLDMNQADYVTCPDWSSGFATVDYDHDADAFHVAQHLIHRGRFRAGGKTYG